jgi:hypothetical protein
MTAPAAGAPLVRIEDVRKSLGAVDRDQARTLTFSPSTRLKAASPVRNR